MKRYIVYILLLIPIVAYAATATINASGNWSDVLIWVSSEIGDDISEDVSVNNSTGTVIIQNGESYIIGEFNLKNDNILIIESGGSLIIGSNTITKHLSSGNASTLQINGNLEIWGDVNLTNSLDLSITGTMIIHGDFNGGNDAILNINGALGILGDINTGNNSVLTGTGAINLTGICNGPVSFCTAAPLGGDTTPPVISNCPNDISVTISAADCDEVVNWTEPTATDDNSVDSFTITHNPGDTFPVGTTTVTYTATDPAGNTASCIFNVTVNDNIPPVISNGPGDIVVNLSGGICDEVVNWIEPIASDNCSVASFNSTHSSGDGFPIGISVVSYIATDSSGNVTAWTFNVTVVDTTPPIFDSCPTTWSIAPFDLASQTAVVTWQEPSASDNCNVVVTGNFNSGDSLPAGLTKVVYTATDDSGNTAICEFEVTVIGNKVPIASPMVIEAFTGEPKEICLDVRDPDDDVLTVTEIDYGTLNGVIDGPGSVDNLCFIYTSFADFEGEELVIFTICDNGTPVACIKVEVRIKVALDLRLKIYKAFTPNNDNINDVWVIENIENYPGNHVSIYDRLGVLIYNIKGYNNDNIVWDGHSNKSGQYIMPSGTYFYKIDLGNDLSASKGYVELIR